jgi:hypothetical protein
MQVLRLGIVDFVVALSRGCSKISQLLEIVPTKSESLMTVVGCCLLTRLYMMREFISKNPVLARPGLCDMLSCKGPERYANWGGSTPGWVMVYTIFTYSLNSKSDTNMYVFIDIASYRSLLGPKKLAPVLLILLPLLLYRH